MQKMFTEPLTKFGSHYGMPPYDGIEETDRIKFVLLALASQTLSSNIAVWSADFVSAADTTLRSIHRMQHCLPHTIQRHAHSPQPNVCLKIEGLQCY